MPVYFPDATVAGVTAMDIVISELLEVDIGAQDWLQNAQLLILEKGTLEQGYRDARLLTQFIALVREKNKKSEINQTQRFIF